MTRLLPFFAGLFFLAGINACSSDPSLQFENPQPLTSKEEAEFPSALWGEYVNLEDSSTLHLTATTLVHRMQFLSPTAVQELAEDSIPYTVENGVFYRNDFPEGLPIIRSTPDSLYLLVSTTDTLFSQDSIHQLRTFKGRYFLNRQVASNRWAVFCLKPEGKKQIQLQYLDDSVDREKMKEIVSVREEKKVFLANPSQKELRKFLRQGGFRQRETFTRVSQE